MNKLESVETLKQKICQLESKANEIEAEKKRLERILSSLDTGLVMIHPDYTISWANDKILEMYPNRNPIGQICYNFFESAEKTCKPCPTIECFKSGAAENTEKFFSSKGKWYKIISQPVKDDDGNVNSVLEGITDITEYKQAQQQVLKEKNLLNKMMETSPVAITLVDREGHITMANALAENVLGLERSNIFNRRYNDVKWHITDFEGNYYPDEDLPFKMVQKKGKPVFGIEHAIIKQNGKKVLLSINAAPLFDKHGNFDGMVSSIEDVTERKNAEALLREKTLLLEQITNKMFDMVSIADIEGYFTFVSKSHERILGYTSEELIGRNVLDFVHPDDFSETAGRFERFLENGGIKKAIYRYKHKDNYYLWFETIGEFFSHENQTPKNIIFSTKNITDRKHSEDELKRTLDATTDGIWSWNFKTGKLAFSPRYYTMLGYEPDAFTACFENWLNLVHPEDRERALAVAQEYLETKPDIYENQFRLKGKTGEYRWIRARARVVERDRDNNAVYMIGNHEDITDRKQFEKEIRFQAQLLDQISDRITATDLEGNIIYVNQAVTIAMQLSREELVGQNVRIYGEDPSQGATQQEIIATTLEKGNWSGEIVNYRPDGSEMLMQCRTQLFKDESGTPVGMIGIATDITTRREKESEYSKILNTATDGFWVIDMSGRLVETNPAAAEMLGYTQEEMAEMTINDIDALEVLEATRQRIESIARRGFARFETLHKRKDGNLVDVEVSTSFLPVGEGKFIAFTRDISSRKKVERENQIHKLRVEIAQKLATLPDADEKEICDFVLEGMLDLSGSQIGFLGYLSKDEQTMQIHSWSSTTMAQCKIHDKPISFPIGQAGLWAEAIRQRGPIIVNDYGAVHPAKKGYPEGHTKITRFMAVPVFDGNRIIALAAVGNKESLYEKIDVRQLSLLMDNWWDQVRRKRMAEDEEKIQGRLQSIQKMEAIGNLAGGIAHDFNNLLFPIIGMSELVLEDLPPGTETRENVLEILKAGKRGRDLVKQILAFSRQSKSDLVPVRFQQVVKEVLKLSRATIPSDIEIKQDIQTDCGLIMAESTQLHQIAMNLITNAYHAVEASGGEIFVRLSEKELTEDNLDRKSLPAGRYAVLSISDTGAGIEPDVKEKIFEPYFTTKEKGKGTGLGLAVVYGIVKEYGGDVAVRSEVGRGTTFEVLLPLIKRKPDMTDTIASEVKAETGTERILLVDDEEPIANLEKQMLKRLGYQVSVQRSSIDALAVFKANPEKFDLLITDMTMPNMTGDQLAREIISIKADFPVIICTGFSERINAEVAEAMGIKGLLMKPVIRKDLAALVRKVLDGAKSETQG